METAPGKVIRSLRQALNMSQAEFARAAGWSPSTISSWERGAARPSRLAFKTILAFAEERGIRYQPKGEAQPSEPAGSTLPVLRMPSRLPMEVVAPERRSGSAGREESFGSRRWTDMAATGVAGTYAPVGTRPERSWQAEATLHVKIGAGNRPSTRTGYVVAAALALMLGLGIGGVLCGGSTVRDVARPVETARAVDATDAAIDAPAGAIDGRDGEPDGEIDAPDVAADALPSAVVAAERADEPLPSGVDDAPVAAAMASAPAALLARLESIVALDGVRRASFRVGDRSIALVEGDQLGGHAVAKIDNEDVTLVGGSDGPRRIRLGFDTPLD